MPKQNRPHCGYQPLTWMLPCILLLALAPWSASALGEPAGNTAPVAAAPAAAAPAPPQADGKAAQELIPTNDVASIMRRGGVLMYPIALCSIILVAFVFERFASLRHGRVIPKPFVTRFLQQIRDRELDRDQALELCDQNGSPVAQVFGGAVRKWGRPSVEVEQGIIDAGERVTNGLRRYLRVFHGISTVAPLMGLLGTVTGIIHSFNDIATKAAMGRPELLASGLSEALLTTAAGLFVAIPAMIVYMYFIGRVDRLIIEIDGLGQQLVDLISSEEIKTRPLDGPKARRVKGQTSAA